MSERKKSRSVLSARFALKFAVDFHLFFLFLNLPIQFNTLQMWMSVKAPNPTIVTLMPHVTTLKDPTHVVVLLDTRGTGKTAQVKII